jgi:type III pantothenate kinase
VLLAIDVGNTNLSLGLFDARHLVLTFRLETDRSLVTHNYAALLRQTFAELHVGVESVAQVVLGSVVPALTPVLIAAVSEVFGCTTWVAGEDIQVPIGNRYDDPRELGIDRLINAYAARDSVGGPVIVLDFGTATKLDCVSSGGEYLGGVIAPGVAIGMDALAQRAARLRRVELQAPPRVVGTNTTHAVQAGVVLGHAALVDGLVLRIERELGYPSQVIATGGLAGLVTPHCATPITLDPDLTLKGLQRLAEQPRTQNRA